MIRPRLQMLVLCLCLVQCVFAYEDLGSIAEAKKTHAYIFVSDEVNKVNIKGSECYVFSGQAEKYSEDETDSELWQEAALSAKNSFFQWMSKGDEQIEVRMTSCSPLYREKRGNVFNLIMSVPCSNVIVSKRRQKDVSTHNTQEQKASTSSNGGSVKNATRATEAIELEGSKANIVVVAPNQIGDGVDDLRMYVADHPKEWRKRGELADRYYLQGKASRALRHYNEAVRSALNDCGAEKKDVASFVYAVALKCDKEKVDNLSLKYYRKVLHLDSSDEMLRNANFRIAQLLLKINGVGSW